VRIPDGVDFDDAAYVTLGAIAMQGVRQADPRLGEIIAVIGLGLLGQLTVQMLRANGCRVLATDIADNKLELARRFGAEQAVSADALADAATSMSGGHGVDAVIIAASTKENTPSRLPRRSAAARAGWSCSGGAHGPAARAFLSEGTRAAAVHLVRPGRYDLEYEEKGLDYPYGYVRWTEGRNMEAFLWLVREGKVDCRTLTTHRFDIEQAEQAYRMMLSARSPISASCSSTGNTVRPSAAYRSRPPRPRRPVG